MGYRLERVYDGVGRVRRRTDLTDKGEIREFLGLLEQLARQRPRLVEMFRDNEIGEYDLLRAAREERISAVLPDERLLVSLDVAFEAAWNTSRAGSSTLARYRRSVKRLQRLCPLPSIGGHPTPTVNLDRVLDLEDVAWDIVAAEWDASPSDYMNFYRMLSTFLTLHLGGGRIGRAHPWRLRVMDMLPRKSERVRMPSLTPTDFRRIVSEAPEHLRASYMMLALTGVRVGEYLAMRREDLRPEAFSVVVRGTKTAESQALLPVDPSVWSWINLAVPSPVAYKALRDHWGRACQEAGLTDVHLHDLRHCFGQWVTLAGIPEPMTQAYLRHKDPTVTRRYTLAKLRRDVAEVIAKVIGISDDTAFGPRDFQALGATDKLTTQFLPKASEKSSGLNIM